MLINLALLSPVFAGWALLGAGKFAGINEGSKAQRCANPTSAGFNCPYHAEKGMVPDPNCPDTCPKISKTTINCASGLRGEYFSVESILLQKNPTGFNGSIICFGVDKSIMSGGAVDYRSAVNNSVVYKNYGAPVISGQTNVYLLYYGDWSDTRKTLITNFVNGIGNSAWWKKDYTSSN